MLSVTILFSYRNPINRLELCNVSLVIKSNGKTIGIVSTYLSISGLVVNTFGSCVLFCCCLKNVYSVFMYVYLLFVKCAQPEKMYRKMVDLFLVIFNYVQSECKCIEHCSSVLKQQQMEIEIYFESRINSASMRLSWDVMHYYEHT